MHILQTLGVATQAWVAPSVAEPLVRRNDKSGVIEPLLATQWEWLDPANPTRLRVKLRPGVKFHNGDVLEAKDVVATVKAMQEPPGQFGKTFLPSLVDAIEVDPLTVDLIANPRDPGLVVRLGFLSIVPRSATGSKGTTTVVGTGPHRLTSWNRGESMLLQRFDGYWGSKPSWDEIQFVFRSDVAVRAAMVKAGEVHIAVNLAPSAASGVPKTVLGHPPDVMGFSLNSRGQKQGGSLFQDIRVRQAVNYAIDREAIVRSVFSGYGALPQGQYALPGTLGHNPDLKDYPYDPQKARQLVADAGATGKTLTMLVPSGSPWTGIEVMSEAVAKMIEATGLKVEMMILDFRTAYLVIYKMQSDGKGTPLPMDMTAWANSSELFDSALKQGTQLASYEAGGGVYETKDATLDTMLASARTEADISKRDQLMRAVWKYVYDQAYALPILGTVTIQGTSANITWEPRGDQAILASEIAWGPSR